MCETGSDRKCRLSQSFHGSQTTTFHSTFQDTGIRIMHGWLINSPPRRRRNVISKQRLNAIRIRMSYGQILYMPFNAASIFKRTLGYSGWCHVRLKVFKNSVNCWNCFVIPSQQLTLSFTWGRNWHDQVMAEHLLTCSCHPFLKAHHCAIARSHWVAQYSNTIGFSSTKMNYVCNLSAYHVTKTEENYSILFTNVSSIHHIALFT